MTYTVPRTVRCLAIAAAFVALPASAQDLPTWAKPSAPSPSSGPEVASMPPSTPGGGSGPSQVPLDGGLGLLALAGGAYAARRLRQPSDDA